MLQEVLVGFAQVVAAAGGAWLAVRVELRWLRADVDRHEKHLDELRGDVGDLQREGCECGRRRRPPAT